MRVCDVTFTAGPLERFALGSLAGHAGDDASIVAGVAWEIEVCPEAAKALKERDWAALASMASLGQPAAPPAKKERKKRTPKTPGPGGQVAGMLAGDDALKDAVAGTGENEWERAANAPSPLNLIHGGTGEDDAPMGDVS